MQVVKGVSVVNGKQKGARGERELANFLKEWGYYARRGVQYEGSSDSPDVVSSLPCFIECKFVERLNVYEALEQATADCGRGEIKDGSEWKCDVLEDMPVVFHRKSKKPWHVTLGADDFMRIIDALVGKDV